MEKNNKDKLLARLKRKKDHLTEALAAVDEEIHRVEGLPNTPNKMTESWKRRQQVYEFSKQGLSFGEIARRQKRSKSVVKHDFWQYEQRYAPLCLVTLKNADQRQWTAIYRYFSRERAEEDFQERAEILDFQQYKPLVWDSFYHGGGSRTECGEYEIVRDGHTGWHSGYFAIHVPSRWESPVYSGDHSKRHERKWILSNPGDDIEISDTGYGREGAKTAAELHAISLWDGAKLLLVSDHIREWNKRTAKWM